MAFKYIKKKIFAFHSLETGLTKNGTHSPPKYLYNAMPDVPFYVPPAPVPNPNLAKYMKLFNTLPLLLEDDKDLILTHD